MHINDDHDDDDKTVAVRDRCGSHKMNMALCTCRVQTELMC